MLYPVLQTKGTLQGALEKVFRISLPLGQENFSAAQAKQTDGEDAPSAAWA